MTLLNSKNHSLTGWTKQHGSLRLGAVRTRDAWLAGIACALLTCCAAAQDKAPAHPGEPLAVIGGKPVYDDQLPADEQAQLARMMQQVYGVKMRALHEVLDQKLIATEAKKKDVSEDELFKSEVVSKVVEPTEEQVRAYYESRPDQVKQPYDDVKDRIRKGLKDVEIQQARAVYVQGLWQQALNDGELAILMSPPKIEIKADPSRLRGDPKAPITIVEFSDYSCPFCRKAESTISGLLAKYPGQVKLTYRDYPLQELHPQAQMAAEASRCAGEQGKYWEYHDLLFAYSDKQGREDLIEDARNLKLDDQQFEACLSSDRYKRQIEQDVQLASRAGIVSTPGFFINGTFVSGAQPAEVFEKIIDRQLAESTQKAAAN
jgi:protein-disulfide isomerase